MKWKVKNPNRQNMHVSLAEHSSLQMALKIITW